MKRRGSSKMSPRGGEAEENVRRINYYTVPGRSYCALPALALPVLPRRGGGWSAPPVPLETGRQSGLAEGTEGSYTTTEGS